MSRSWGGLQASRHPGRRLSLQLWLPWGALPKARQLPLTAPRLRQRRACCLPSRGSSVPGTPDSSAPAGSQHRALPTGSEEVVVTRACQPETGGSEQRCAAPAQLGGGSFRRRQWFDRNLRHSLSVCSGQPAGGAVIPLLVSNAGCRGVRSPLICTGLQTPEAVAGRVGAGTREVEGSWWRVPGGFQSG